VETTAKGCDDGDSDDGQDLGPRELMELTRIETARHAETGPVTEDRVLVQCCAQCSSSVLEYPVLVFATAPDKRTDGGKLPEPAGCGGNIGRRSGHRGTGVEVHSPPHLRPSRRK